MIRKRQNDTAAWGFTIVELLIVIVVIGILAAITIVSFNGVQGKAYDTTVQNDLSQFAKRMEFNRAETGVDAYPATLTAAMGFRFGKDAYSLDNQSYTIRYCVNTVTNEYVLLSKSKSGTYYKYLSSGGMSTNPATSGYGVCNLVGLASQNPSSANNGLNNSTWSAWTNN